MLQNTLASSKKSYLKSSFIFVTLSLISAALNYLYYPVIARFLNISDFGIAQSMIAVTLQISAVFAGLNLVTVYVVHHLREESAKKTIEALQRLAIYFFVITALLLLLFGNPIITFLNIDNSLYVFLVCLNLISSIPFIVAFGFMQAKRRFLAAGMIQLCVVTTKLFAGAILAYIYGPKGALIAVTVGQILGVIIFWFACVVTGRPAWEHSMLSALSLPRMEDLKIIRPQLVNIVSIFTVSVILALYISFDILSARHYFDAQISGLYAGASTLSNTIVFVSLPLIGVLLPNLDIRTLKHSLSSLQKTAIMMFGASITALIFFSVIPEFILGFFGQDYKQVSYLLVQLGFMMTLVSFITLVFQVSAFYKPKQTAIISVFGLVGLIFSVSIHHATPRALISTITFVFATILFIGCVLLSKNYQYEKESSRS